MDPVLSMISSAKRSLFGSCWRVSERKNKHIAVFFTLIPSPLLSLNPLGENRYLLHLFSGRWDFKPCMFTIDRFALLVNWNFRFEGLVRLLIETDAIYAFMFLNIK